ncbi:HD domain-containing protein [Dehalococcoidia bacterium]|nr:HD domain-containing protein [Dehalococcoidia bacterium]
MDETNDQVTHMNSGSPQGPSGQVEQLLKQVDLKLHKRFVEIKAKVIDSIAGRQQRSDDTESGEKHLRSVHELVDRLVPLNKLQNYNPIELFILLVAVYLHDIGKSLGGKVDNNTHHAITGRNAIIRAFVDLGLEEPEALAVGYLVEGHGHGEIKQLPEKTGVYPHGVIRIRYLSALLRLADDLDMCFTRAPRIACNLIQPESDIASKWILRQSIWNIEIDSESWYIEVQATPKTIADQAAVLHEIDIVNGRLADARKHLRATPDIGLYYSVVDPYIDDYWIRDALESQTQESESSPSDEQFMTVDLPDNTVCVILRYDPTSVSLYKEVVSPCLEECDFSPVLIEDLPPERTLLQRTNEVIESSKIVIVLLLNGGGPSVLFRLGVAMGLRKKIVAFTNSNTTAVGDLCGMEMSVFKDKEDLRQQLRANLKQS